MGQGLYFNPNDGGPAMEIKAGLRCPSFSGAWVTGDGVTKTINNYNPASNIFVVPRNCAGYSGPTGTDVIGTINMVESFTFSGNTITQNLWNSKGQTNTQGRPASIWQIFPPGGSGTGLLIQNSTDYTQIPAAAPVGFCVWRGQVSFTGDMNLPDTGYDLNNLMVFAAWSAPGVTVELYNGVLSAYQDRNGDDVPATVSMTLAIFAAGVDPTPSTGLTFFVGGRCTFSLNKRPFVFQGATWTPSFNSVDIGANLVLIGNYGFDSDTQGGWDRMKLLGVIRSGNTVSLGRGKERYRWTDRYSIVNRKVTSLVTPLVPNMY